jgi:4a-hydroxytetrahydrobiopterin dehydratase
MRNLLTDEDIDEALSHLPAWERRGDALRRKAEAPDFMTGIGLVNEVAKYAEEINHHPDIDIRWRNVVFTLSTHSEGGITELDVQLAHQIDELSSQHGVKS